MKLFKSFILALLFLSCASANGQAELWGAWLDPELNDGVGSTKVITTRDGRFLADYAPIVVESATDENSFPKIQTIGRLFQIEAITGRMPVYHLSLLYTKIDTENGNQKFRGEVDVTFLDENTIYFEKSRTKVSDKKFPGGDFYAGISRVFKRASQKRRALIRSANTFARSTACWGEISARSDRNSSV